jgi:hypothetical protein
MNRNDFHGSCKQFTGKLDISRTNWSITMNMQRGRTRIFALLLGLTALAWAMWASADPPTRVARLGYLSGAVSFSPGGENDCAGDDEPAADHRRSSWVDAGARAGASRFGRDPHSEYPA